MIINHNLSAMNAHRVQGESIQAVSKGMEKLASGYRINRAGDDASGLAVSEKMRAQIRGLNQASRNANDGISFIQTAEGYLSESQDVLHRIRELAVQSANGIYTASDRKQIQVEVSQLVDEIDRIASHAQFNTKNIFTGAFAREEGTNQVPAEQNLYFHIGANTDQRMRIYVGTMTSAALGLKALADGKKISLESSDDANRAIMTMDNALHKVSKQRADLGAYQNRLEFTVKGLDIGAENLQASESRIRDVDMARQMVEHSKYQILVQSGNAMLAQANQRPQSTLQLLQ